MLRARTKNITLTSTPTLVTFYDEVNLPTTISLQNTDNSSDLYVGTSTVSASSYGVKLSPGQIWSADLAPYDRLYAVGNGTIAILTLDR